MIIGVGSILIWIVFVVMAYIVYKDAEKTPNKVLDERYAKGELSREHNSTIYADERGYQGQGTQHLNAVVVAEEAWANFPQYENDITIQDRCNC